MKTIPTRAVLEQTVNRLTALVGQITAELATVKTDLAALDVPDDAIAQLTRGDLLVTTQAADVAGRDADTINRWCRDAEENGAPLGVLSPAGWIIVRDRFLAYIEMKKGLHARRIAETRARKYSGTWSQPLQLKRSNGI
jgi:hypothetical protein